MSLLMDALRKAEQAKKKAELESKSARTAADKGKDDENSMPDVALEFEPETGPELPIEETELTAEVLSESASAHDMETAEAFDDEEDNDEEVADAGAVARVDQSGEQSSDEAYEDESDLPLRHLDPEESYDTLDTDDWEEPDTYLAAEEEDFAADEADESIEPSVPEYQPLARPEMPRPATTSYDTYGIDYLPTRETPAQASAQSGKSAADSADSAPWKTHTAAPEATRARAGSTPARDLATDPATAENDNPAPKTPGFATRATALVFDDVDTAMEEQERRSALRVFAAKRGGSPLQKNLQLAAMSIAAVLIVAVGIYFYINLRTGGGIAIPGTGFEQVRSDFSDEFITDFPEDLDTEVPDTTVALDTEITVLPANPIPEPVPAPVIDQEVVLADTPGPGVASDPTLAQAGAALTASAVSAPSQDPPVASPVTTTAPRDTPSPAIPVPSQTLADNADAVAITTPDSTAPASAASTVPQLEPQPITSQPAPEPAMPVAVVSFSRRETPPSIDPLVMRAYAAYQGGDLTQAERLYREVLESAPLHRNALLGLAAIAARQDDTVQALELYSRLLARDPSDPVAQAGLLEIMPRGNPQQQEQELRRLRNQHPDVAPLAYAMGNFLASQQRWSEAQQAYFSALQLARNAAPGAPVNPDYAFNLAVSLEHLGQQRPAGNYYREALALAETHPAGFDLSLARQRLGSMESAANE